MRKSITIYIPVTAAGTSETWGVLYPFDDPARIVSAAFMPAATVAGHAANYWDLSLDVDGTEVASEQNTVADLNGVTDGTEVAIAITGSAGDAELTSGSWINAKKTDAGAGMAIHGSVSLLVETYRGA